MGCARRFFQQFGERGIVAVEFAIVGGVFLLLLLGIFELGFMLFVQSVLDDSARSAARLIRTGQAQSATDPNGNPDPQTFFQTALCSGVVSSIIGCGNIIYQVRVFPNWSGSGSVQAALTPSPCDPKKLTPPAKCNPFGGSQPIAFSTGNCSTPGNPQIVAVQVAYDYKFFTPLVGSRLGGSSNSTFLASTVVFQNEPYCTNG